MIASRRSSASWRTRSSMKSSYVQPLAISRASRAARSISANRDSSSGVPMDDGYARSCRRQPSSRRGVDGLCRFEDPAAPNPVRAPLNRFALHQINRSPEHLTQLFFHIEQVTEPHARAVREGHKHIDIALRVEVVAQHGAEELEACDLPLLAERLDLLV